jgi:hypothetical protein
MGGTGRKGAFEIMVKKPEEKRPLDALQEFGIII